MSPKELIPGKLLRVTLGLRRTLNPYARSQINLGSLRYFHLESIILLLCS